MEGLFELLIILAIVLFPVLEAIAKKRKQERRKGEMGGEEPEEWPPPTRTDEPGRSADAEGRSGSEVLLPEDLWEELTGERRRQETEAEEAGVTTEGDPVPGTRPLEGPEQTRGTTEPAAGTDPGPAPWRDTAPAEEGPGAADLGGRMTHGRSGPGDTEVEPSVEPSVGPAPAGPSAPDTGEVGRGEIGSRAGLSRRRAADLQRMRTGRMARRGAPAAGARPTHPLIGDLDRRELRRAVVLQEILAPPVSLRDE